MPGQFLETNITYIATQTTTVIEATSKKLFLHTVTVPIASTGTITFEDVAGSPVTYFVLPIGSVGTFTFDCALANGLKVVTSAADKLVVNWMQ